MPQSRRRNLDVKITFGKRAENMLLDFVNTRPDDQAFSAFTRKWQRYGLKWTGGASEFRHSQSIVRAIWEGQKKGLEGFQVELSLGLQGSDGEEVPPPPIRVDWPEGSLTLLPRNFEDLVWLTLLQHSRHLGICETYTKGGGCPTPYFLKYRPKARFCSETCALPAQRESKRKWWNEKGADWTAARRKSGKRNFPRRTRG